MRTPLVSSPLGRGTLLLLTAVLVAACGSSGPAASTSPSARPPTAPAATATSPGSGAAQAGCDTGPWGAAPITVSHSVPVPPVPVVTAIRAAAHADCGYDRLVLDVSGKLPGYTIRYVDRVVADPSGKVVTVPGSHFLLVTLRPGQAHRAGGQATLSGAPVRLGLPALAGYALAGDFEGVVTVAVGLSAAHAIRVGELPGRLVIDVKT